MGISLAKGQGISLAKEAPGVTDITLGLGWSRKKAASAAGFFSRLLGTDSEEQDIDLDASVLVFDENNNMIDQVWFRQLKSQCGNIVHTGDDRSGGDGKGDNERINIKLNKLNRSAAKLIVTINSYTGEKFSDVATAHTRIFETANGREIASYNLTDRGNYTGLIVARIERRADNSWDVTALGQPTNGRVFSNMMSDIRMCL